METPRDRKEDCECEPEEQKVIRPQGQMTKATDDFRHNPQEPHRVQDTQREAYVHSPVGGWQWAKRRLEQTSRIFHKPGLEWHMESTKQPGQRDRLSVTVGLTKGLHTRWLGRMPRNNPLGSLLLPVCCTVELTPIQGKARLAPRRPQPRLQAKQTLQCDGHSLGTPAHQEGWGWMLPPRRPRGREKDEVGFEEVGLVVGLVTQDFGCSSGSPPTCHPLASA